MPTDAQIEAVAREICPGLMDAGLEWSDIERIARAAIEAYEATRPAMTDEELARVFANALENEHDKGAATTREQLANQVLAGIRAVRERLEGGKDD